MNRCDRHQMLSCALCSGRPLFTDTRARTGADQLSLNGGARWDDAEIKLLTEQSDGLEIGPELRVVFRRLSFQFGRTYQAVYDQWLVITGRRA